MECHRPVASACPLSSSSAAAAAAAAAVAAAQNTWNTWDQDPYNAYNNGYYHYQAYLYYWNLYNSHFGQGRDNSSYCECYDNGHGGQEGPNIALSSSRCGHCPEEGYSQFMGHLKPNETQTHFHKESYNMDVEGETYDDIDGAEAYDDDDDEHNFELDERFCQFLRQSEKHRQEREKEKRANAKLDEYVEAGKPYINPSTLPPQEQQGVKRKEAMKSLYGDKAQYIMSLEASLQLRYDKNYDTRQPKFWPNIPLKF